MIDYNYNCPVCGYKLWFLPWEDDSPSDEICPSCGIQFGYSDAAGGDEEKRLQLYKDWRKKWIDNGGIWNGAGIPKPENWDPIKQVKDVANKFK
jgi:DNA-directed RNA polymerase subunit RPC12/RpoP